MILLEDTFLAAHVDFVSAGSPGHYIDLLFWLYVCYDNLVFLDWASAGTLRLELFNWAWQRQFLSHRSGIRSTVTEVAVGNGKQGWRKESVICYRWPLNTAGLNAIDLDLILWMWRWFQVGWITLRGDKRKELTYQAKVAQIQWRFMSQRSGTRFKDVINTKCELFQKIRQSNQI